MAHYGKKSNGGKGGAFQNAKVDGGKCELPKSRVTLVRGGGKLAKPKETHKS